MSRLLYERQAAYLTGYQLDRSLLAPGAVTASDSSKETL